MRRLLSLLLLAPLAALANAVTLDATTKTLELTTGVAVSTDYVVSYVDGTSTTFVPGTSQGNVSTATTTAILAAPAASTQRAVSLVVVTNRGTARQTAQIKLDVSATEYALTPAIALGAGEALRLDNEGRVEVLSSAGTRREAGWVNPGYSGTNFTLFKVGTASEAVAIKYSTLKDTGLPGAWVPGTPGLNGTATDCSSTTPTAGLLRIPNPVTGSLYLTYGSVSSTVAHSHELYDLLWYNTGIVITTTTAQAITSPTWPARDAEGSTNGVGLLPAILVTTATTNAGAITNTTLSYTNESGTSGRTATIASFPATAVLGTLVPFQLAAGDRGVRSIQSITLGTSYAAGAISLVVLQGLMRYPTTVVNVGSMFYPPQSPGVRLYNGTCLMHAYVSAATTATTTVLDVWVMER